MATSLNALSMIIGMNTDQVTAGVGSMRQQLGRANRIMQMSKTESDKLAEGTQALSVAYHKGSIDQSKLAKGLSFLQHQYGGGSRAAKEAAASQERVRRIVEQTVPQTTKLAMQIRELRREYKAGNITADQFTRANVKLRSQYDHLKNGAKQAGNSMETARRKFDEWRKSVRGATSEMHPMVRSLGSLAATYLSFQGIRSLAGLTNEFTQAKISLEVFTGSAEQAGTMLKEIRDFAADSPLGFGDVMKGSTTMLAFGAAADSVIPKLKMLGDISGGNAERFQSLSLAFSQTQAAGRLMGQEVLQFVNAGFNPLQQISEDTGISMGRLKKQMENGAISFEMVAQAMKSATQEGGRFYGMTEKQANTAGGAVTQLKSATQELAAQFGSVFEPAVRDLAKALKSMVEWIQGIASGLTEGQAKMLTFVSAFGAGAMAAKVMISVIQGIIAATRLMTSAQITALAFMGPKGWAQIAAGAAVAATAVWAVSKAFDEHAKNAHAAAGGTDDAADSAKRASSVYDSLRTSVERTAGPMQALLQNYTDQNMALALGADYAERAKAAREGASEGELAELKHQQERNAMLQEEKRLREEMARDMEQKADKYLRDQEKRLKDLVKAGQEVRDSLRSPFEVAADEIARLMMLLRGGFIDSATFAKASKEAAKGARKDSTPPAIAAIEAGSEEAYKRLTGQITDRREKQLAKLEEQRLLQAAMVRAQQETNRRMAELQTVAKAR